MNWYKKSNITPPPTQQATTQPQAQPQAQNPNQLTKQDEQAANQEVSSNIKKLRDYAVKWMLNSEMVARYMANPTDESRQELASTALNEAIRAIAGELPYIGGLAKKNAYRTNYEKNSRVK